MSFIFSEMEIENDLWKSKTICGNRKRFEEIENNFVEIENDFEEIENDLWKSKTICRNRKRYVEIENNLWKSKTI